MKYLWLLIALAFIFAGFYPQLRTRYRPLWPQRWRKAKRSVTFYARGCWLTVEVGRFV